MAKTEDTAAPEFLPLPEGPRVDLAEQAAGEIELLARTLREHAPELADDHRFMGVLFARMGELSQVIQTALACEASDDYHNALSTFRAGH